MTSSLVGSEMCIRDSNIVDLMARADILKATETTRWLQQIYKALGMFAQGAVSYTHLTLPTICSV
eukprot:4181599-Prorocentrum_lima.AAC.1